jgi:Conjugal transfer protein TraD
MASDAARKTDTYRKIQLGGLVIKSGMAGQPPTVILGALIEALQRMQSDRSHAARYKVLGDASFARGQGRDEGLEEGR